MKQLLQILAFVLISTTSIFAQEVRDTGGVPGLDDLYLYKATIISAYDGDTCTALIDLGFDITVKKRLRLLHIDTPELRGSEREEGLKVRDIVRNLIVGKTVYIRTFKDKTGKYGRLVAEIWMQDENEDLFNVNLWLYENGYAELKYYD